MLNLTNDFYTREELTVAIYNEAISGWGYIPSLQVDLYVNSCTSKVIFNIKLIDL